MCAEVFAPIVAQGVIVRRPGMLKLAGRYDVARRGNALMTRLRAEYGPEPLEVNVFGRRVVLPLTAADAREVLERSPNPFTPANKEKTAALAHFEPQASLITRGPRRAARRRFSEDVLETPQAAHHLSGVFLDVIRQDIRALLANANGNTNGSTNTNTTLDWDTFHGRFLRSVRRIVLGEGAADDTALTGQLDALRADANWAFAHRRRGGVHDRFTSRLNAHLARAEPGSLAACAANTARADGVDPAGQVPHWLFAYDAAAIAAYNALTLLAAHPAYADRARNEQARRDPADPQGIAAAQELRACVLESLRLWPTTLVILRDATHGDRLAPGGAAVAVISSFFHRDAQTLEFADRFAPEAWSNGLAEPARGIVPFSAGPAACPGRNLVLFTVSAVLDTVLRETTELRPAGHTALDPGRPLPHTWNHTEVRLTAGR
ncbi:cytochrome P450 [Embleya scabrispora]|uniref:cytochrome P450 n=1 Tax=Embleya scabrispora TaxID=159449 RepID=UPI0019123E1B|nr:cytochrome P450 [Embleya scabrispora]